MTELLRVKITDIEESEYLKEYNRLSQLNIKRISRMRTDDKRRSLAGLILLRRLINKNFKRDDYTFSYNENGKPLLDFCCFSISHSGEYSVCVVSEDPVGVDIELVRPISIKNDYRLFTLEEIQYVNSDENLHNNRFFEVWTKKEAYIKMKGLNLSQGAGVNTVKIKDAVFETEFTDGYMQSLCKNI